MFGKDKENDKSEGTAAEEKVETVEKVVEVRTGRRGGGFLRTLLMLVIIALALYAGMQLKDWLDHKDDPDVTAGYVSSRIEEASELTTAKMIYNGLVTYEDGDIPFLTKKAFVMVYSADIRAGVDVSEIKFKVTEDEVRIAIPKATVQSIAIDPDSIQFYDTRRALLNWSEREDVKEALQLAQENVETSADTAALLEEADKQAEKVISELLKDGIGERKIVFVDKLTGDTHTVGEDPDAEDTSGN